MIYRTSMSAAAMMAIALGSLSANVSASEPAAMIQEPDLALMDQVLQSSREEGQYAEHGRNAALIGGLVAGALIGNAVSSERRQERRYYRDPPPPPPRYYRERRPYYDGGGYQAAKRRCANRYNSYDWGTDTYINYDGYEVLCPYVSPYR